MDYRKHTTGYVTQGFKDGKCVEQHFIAGGHSDYEDYETKEETISVSTA